MPSYDYKCKDCERVFTVNKSMTDTTVPDCVQCNGQNVVKVWGNVQFKGMTNGPENGSSKCGSCSSSSCSTCGH